MDSDRRDETVRKAKTPYQHSNSRERARRINFLLLGLGAAGAHAEGIAG
jgi:hypothetical protein